MEKSRSGKVFMTLAGWHVVEKGQLPTQQRAWAQGAWSFCGPRCHSHCQRDKVVLCMLFLVGGVKGVGPGMHSSSEAECLSRRRRTMRFQR